jgi:hypothetical protein
MTDIDSTTWDDLCPDGAIRYYEGDDPDGFVAEMKANFGFDPSEGGEARYCRRAWTEEPGFSFLIPAGLVEAVYGSERYPLGS